MNQKSTVHHALRFLEIHEFRSGTFRTNQLSFGIWLGCIRPTRQLIERWVLRVEFVREVLSFVNFTIVDMYRWKKDRFRQARRELKSNWVNFTFQP